MLTQRDLITCWHLVHCLVKCHLYFKKTQEWEETQTQKVLSGTVSQNLGKDYGFVAVLSLCFTIVASKCWINSSKSRFFRPDATGQFVVLSWWKKKQKDGCCVDVIALYLDTDTGVIQSHQNNVFSLVLQYSSIITHLGIHELWKNQTKLQNSFIHLDIQKRLNTQSSLRRVFT